uniref:NHR2-like domain-containing protein n=1 Tax=Laticauda laticaudata TaxID=8630 RepID=A0A8C5SS81_LATLA
MYCKYVLIEIISFTPSSFFVSHYQDSRLYNFQTVIFPYELVDHRLTEREWADEWKHLDHALNCIMEMVEKTKRSMAVLRRCQEADREELNYWKRRCSEPSEPRKGGSDSAVRQHSPASSDTVNSGMHGHPKFKAVALY